MPRYELEDGKTKKFWEIEVDGDSFTVRYGRIGTDGQSSTKVYADAATAQKEADKLAKSKVKKGYAFVEGGGASKPAGADAIDNPELEAPIFANPEDLDAWAAYGAWLTSKDDVRGQLVALEIERAKGGDVSTKIDALIQEHQARWLGKDLMKALADDSGYDGPVLELEWRFGFLWKVKARTHYDYEGPSVETMLRAAMKSSASKFVHAIHIGMTDPEGETTFHREILAITKAGKRPSVRRVYVGDFEFPDETEISWTEVGSVDKLYPVFPNLEWLKVQGGGIELGALKHPKLQSLTVHTGGLPAAAARSIAQADLPALTSLEVWFGADDYGGEAEVGQLGPLFAGAGVPKLERLGLMNAEFTNGLPAALAGTPLLARLKSLDLSMGTMTKDGGQALLDHADAFGHLERLSVDENILDDEMVAKLKATFGGRLVSSEQKEYEEDWLYVSVGE